MLLFGETVNSFDSEIKDTFPYLKEGIPDSYKTLVLICCSNSANQKKMMNFGFLAIVLEVMEAEILNTVPTKPPKMNPIVYNDGTHQLPQDISNLLKVLREG
jgi:hypothetical protein